jgi:hypothetical protein
MGLMGPREDAGLRDAQLMGDARGFLWVSLSLFRFVPSGLSVASVPFLNKTREPLPFGKGSRR